MNRRSSLTFGILLILLGAWFLAIQLVPGLENWIDKYGDWPLWIVGIGVIFLVSAVASGVSGLAVPGSIVSGIGGILWYQNSTGYWESWAYVWTLIIGFVGIGVFIMHTLDGNYRQAFKEGGATIFTSAVMFLIFGSFFRYIFGEEPFLGEYWPVLLIVWGFWLLVKPIFIKPPRKSSVEVEMVVETEE